MQEGDTPLAHAACMGGKGCAESSPIGVQQIICMYMYKRRNVVNYLYIDSIERAESDCL